MQLHLDLMSGQDAMHAACMFWTSKVMCRRLNEFPFLFQLNFPLRELYFYLLTCVFYSFQDLLSPTSRNKEGRALKAPSRSQVKIVQTPMEPNGIYIIRGGFRALKTGPLLTLFSLRMYYQMGDTGATQTLVIIMMSAKKAEDGNILQ